MQQNHVKTPCRTVGLRRIPSAIKSGGRLALEGTSEYPQHSDNTPKSTGGQPKCEPAQRCLEDALAVQNVSPFDAESLSGDQYSDRSFHKRPLGLLVTPQDSQGNSKKVRTVSTPTLEDLIALRKRVQEKERQHKELQQAQIIFKKHDPEKLQSDIQLWLRACQGALQELLETVNSRGSSMDMKKLLEELGIPSSLVHFNMDCEDFM